jgi:hypothetical protein
MKSCAWSFREFVAVAVQTYRLDKFDLILERLVHVIRSLNHCVAGIRKGIFEWVSLPARLLVFAFKLGALRYPL